MSSTVQQEEHFRVTQAETQVLEWKIKGYSNDAIGKKLCIAEKTVDLHMQHARERNNSATTIQLVAEYIVQRESTKYLGLQPKTFQLDYKRRTHKPIRALTLEQVEFEKLAKNSSISIVIGQTGEYIGAKLNLAYRFFNAGLAYATQQKAANETH